MVGLAEIPTQTLRRWYLVSQPEVLIISHRRTSNETEEMTPRMVGEGQ